MCVPGCMDVVHRRLTRRGFFHRASLAAASASALATMSGLAQAEQLRFTSVLDLTHTLTPDFPTFTGKPGIEIERLVELRKDGYNMNAWRLVEGPSADFKTHYLWLPSGRWGLENVANLDQTPAAGATLVVGLPKVKDATGAPVRLFALM